MLRMAVFTQYPGYTSRIVLLQLGFVATLGYLIREPPSPGKAVAVLGVAAVVMAVRAEHFTRPEKIAWVVIATAFVYLEIHAIDRDRFVHDRQQVEVRGREAEHFGTIVADLRELVKQEQIHFDASANRLDENLHRSTRILTRLEMVLEAEEKALAVEKRTLDEITGGEGYAYVLVAPRGSLHPPQDKWPLVIMNSGNIPIPEVSAFITELPAMSDLPEQQVNKILLRTQLEIGTVHPCNRAASSSIIWLGRVKTT